MKVLEKMNDPDTWLAFVLWTMAICGAVLAIGWTISFVIGLFV